MAILLFLLLLLQGLPQIPEIIMYTDAPEEALVRLGVDEGLSDGTINAMTFDKHGFFWAATNNGMNRYDGYTFRWYALQTAEKQQLSEQTHSLFTDSENTLWVTTRSGSLFFYDEWHDRFTPVGFSPELKDTFSANPVMGLIGDAQQGWILGNANGLHRLTPSFETEALPLSGTGSITSYFSDHDQNQLYLTGFRTGVFRYDVHGQELIPLSRLNEQIDRYATTHISKTHDGYYYVTEHHVIYYFSPDQELIHTETAGLSRIYFTHTDQHGNLWYMQGFTTIKFDRNSLESSLYFRIRGAVNMTTDPNDRIWIGTAGGISFGKGIFTFRPVSRMLGYTKKTFSDIEAPGFDRKVSNQFPELDNRMQGRSDLFIDPNQEHIRWILSFDSGLFAYDTRTSALTHYPFAYPSPSADAPSLNQAFYRDEDGLFYIITNHGLVIFDTEQGIQETIPRSDIFGGSLSTVVNQLVKIDDTLWFATRSLGVVSYNLITRNHAAYSLQQHTRPQPRPQPGNTVALSCTPKPGCKHLWIATAFSGLYKIDLDSGELTFIANMALNQADGFHGMLTDRNGNLWLSSNIGIITYNPETDTAIRYTKRDGLQNDVFTRYHFLGYPDGSMLFCGTEGCNRFHPNALGATIMHKPVVFTDILLRDRSVLPYSAGWFHRDETYRLKLRINWRDQLLRLKFAALSFAPDGHNRYKYRLSPNLNDWIEIGSLTELSFTNLDPGLHTLEIKGGDSDGNWSAQAAVLPITVIPPFWMTFTFRASLILLFTFLIAGLSWGVTRQRYKARLRQLEYKLAVDQERLRISRDMHDDIGSRLTLIKMMTEQLSHDEHDSKAKPFATLSKETTEIMTSLSEIVWALNPKNDALENLAGFIIDHTERYCHKCGISFRVEAQDEFPDIVLPSATRHHLLHIAKEALTNAIRHSGCTTIHLSIHTSAAPELIITFTDNGSGFDTGHPLHKYGNGLTSMQERIRECGGRLEIKSQKNEGTRIRIQCPIQTGKDPKQP